MLLQTRGLLALRVPRPPNQAELAIIWFTAPPDPVRSDLRLVLQAILRDRLRADSGNRVPPGCRSVRVCQRNRTSPGRSGGRVGRGLDARIATCGWLLHRVAPKRAATRPVVERDGDRQPALLQRRF